MAYESWGRAIPSVPAKVLDLHWPPTQLDVDDLVLPYGLGRSYGDVCLNNEHTLLSTARMDHFQAFDPASGVLTCEAGTTLDAILAFAVPRGWFPPVTPGTRFVTVGGCIANDVHGKNHHRAGTLGRWVRSIELLRSDGSRKRCSPAGNPGLFAATIGGLGLTGLILSAEIEMRPIPSPMILAEQIPFGSLAEFDALSRASDVTHEYTVAWFDSLGTRGARGMCFRGNHASGETTASPARKPRRLPIGLFAPFLNPLSVRLFNEAYFRSHATPSRRLITYDGFFYPLDSIGNWNAMYGRRGFMQYQFVIPDASGLAPVAEIIERAARSKLASFLTVIKRFGSLPSPGIMSFPRAGITVCFDFAASNRTLRPLLDELDEIVIAARGAVYPAKDARMSAASFRTFFPRWEEFAAHVDPKFSSSFWRRVTK